MSTEIEIARFNGTPLLALANNANVNGGKTLTKVEFAIMQQQMKNLGMSFEDYGLQIVSNDFQGENAKGTRNNVAEVGTELNKAYKKQFGAKNIAAVKLAEVKADSIVKTALDMFKSEHADVVFVPKSLSARPLFTNPAYLNNSTLYAVELTDWANTVKAEYINASKLSNEALAAMIISNDNANTFELSAELSAFGAAILEQVAKGTATIIDTVNVSANRIEKTIRDAEGHIVKVVQDSAGNVIDVVKEEGIKTRNTVRDVGADVINDNRVQHTITRDRVAEEGADTRNTTKQEAQKSRMYTKQKAEETQEIETMNTAIAERLNRLQSTLASRVKYGDISQRIGNMQKQIVESDIPHSKKMELLQAIRNQLGEKFISTKELNNLQERIDNTIMKNLGKVDSKDIPSLPDYPRYEGVPDYVEPIHEKTESTKENNSAEDNNKNKAQTTPKKEEPKCETPVTKDSDAPKKSKLEKDIAKEIGKILNKK